MTPDMSFGPMGVETGQNGQLGGQNVWLGVERCGWMAKMHGWGQNTWLDGQNAWLGVGTCSWGLKHVAGGWEMCIIEQISEKTHRKKKENVPRAQMTCLHVVWAHGC